MAIFDAVLHALQMAGIMAWEILWALILGFWLSAVIQAVVSKEEMSRLLPDDSPRTIALACGLGAASSSCYTLRCPGPFHVPQGSELHGSDGLSICFHQPRP